MICLWKEEGKGRRQYQRDTLGKLSFIVFKKSLHSLSTADKISKRHFETFGVQSVRIVLSDFSLQLYI